jgi:signal transduction histidine kinase
MTTVALQTDERAFWERTRIGWHVAFYAALALATVFVAADTDLPLPDRLAAFGLAAFMAVSYTVLGRQVLGAEQLSGPVVCYLLSVWLPFLVLIGVDPAAYLLLFVLLPQTWADLPTRAAVVWIVLATLAMFVTGLIAGRPAGQLAIESGVNLAFSLFLGLWITGVINESEKRAALIEELQETRAQLAAAEHERGVLTERQRLAHEIHDTLAQGFMSIIALAQAVEATMEHDPEAARKRLALLDSTARANLAEARALVADLGPVDLRQATLPEAIERLVSRVGQQLDIPARFVLEGQPRELGANTDVVLVRATQEALANVRKHSGARHVTVRLKYADNGTALEVRDDGCGFNPQQANGFGLHGMRSRVKDLGGELLINSNPGAGTKATVWVP